MKRASILKGIAIGSLVVLFMILVAKLFGLPHHEAVAHPQAWGHGFGRRGWQPPSTDGQAVAVLPIVTVVLRVIVLFCGAVVLFKAKGLLRWAGALIAAVSLMSLLTPFWGLAVVALVIWLTFRIKRNEAFEASAQEAVPSPYTTSMNRGQFLDEWERSQYKEER
ncbi:hypothetical protein [Cohnella hashimotonis]|uniref:DUF4064 domain-containing protein n=1 Tax=Cohnella hashimotonis TaxID=2826895 RepID=A0ABT6TDY1_9BACL|nr:hypothetical protein [Cohnella hashimotonis]MDI4644545.1 hypothetical protein [Cohnella hashimotonis]